MTTAHRTHAPAESEVALMACFAARITPRHALPPAVGVLGESPTRQVTLRLLPQW